MANDKDLILLGAAALGAYYFLYKPVADTTGAVIGAVSAPFKVIADTTEAVASFGTDFANWTASQISAAYQMAVGNAGGAGGYLDLWNQYVAFLPSSVQGIGRLTSAVYGMATGGWGQNIPSLDMPKNSLTASQIFAQNNPIAAQIIKEQTGITGEQPAGTYSQAVFDLLPTTTTLSPSTISVMQNWASLPINRQFSGLFMP